LQIYSIFIHKFQNKGNVHAKKSRRQLSPGFRNTGDVFPKNYTFPENIESVQTDMPLFMECVINPLLIHHPSSIRVSFPVKPNPLSRQSGLVPESKETANEGIGE
jgi:hypothetical protein